MDIIVEKPVGAGKVKAVASKSQTHRMLICAALAEGRTYIKCSETSQDILATVSCLENLGARIRHDGAGFHVDPAAIPLSPGETIVQHCGESSSTLRFMLPICCALGACADFVMDGRLSKLPMSPLRGELTAHGCEIAEAGGADDVLRCSGKLASGVYELPGNISSQYISGMLIALTLPHGDSVLSIVGREESRPYIAMTLDVLNMFGVSIKHFATNPAKGAAYGIMGSQRFISPGAVSIEGDWSNAALWLCAGVASGAGVTCTGLNLGSTQGDMAIMRILERFGAGVAYGGDRVAVAPAKLRGIEIDAIDTPDLVPALAVVASVAKGETVIYNAGRLRMKESNRLYAIEEALTALGADVTGTKDGLLIRGKAALRGGTVMASGDHRIAMMASIASAICEGPVTICGAEAVNKSYPGFFRDFESLGGQIRVL